MLVVSARNRRKISYGRGMGISDVNWLLAALVQSGAAIVAIVGGIAASRFVSLHAEQQSASQQLHAITLSLQAASLEALAAETRLNEFRVRELLDTETCYEYLTIGSEPKSLDDFLENSNTDEKQIPKDLLEAHFKLLMTELEAASAFISAHRPSPDLQMEWPTFRRAHGAQPMHDDIWEWVFDQMKKAQDQEQLEIRRERIRQGPFAGLAEIAIPAPMTYGIRFPEPSVYRANTISRFHSAADDAQARVSALEADRRALMHRVSSTAQPEGIGLTIEILGLLSVLTILVPLVPLVQGFERLPMWARIGVSGSFTLGLACLLCYLATYAKFLTSGLGQPGFPRHAWQIPRYLVQSRSSLSFEGSTSD